MSAYSQTGTLSQLGDAVNLLVGKHVTTPSQDLVFEEYYVPNANAMTVTVPIAQGGASPMKLDQSTFIPLVSYQTQTVSASSSPNSAIQIQTVYNSGINVTGPNLVGTTPNDALKNLGIDTLSQISQTFGAAVGPFALEYDLQSLSGVNSYQLGVTGNGAVYENFRTTGGTVSSSMDQDVFTSQTYTLLTIPSSEFLTYPVFTVTGTNLRAPFNTQSASASISIPAYPAVKLSGQVTAAGKAVAGATVTLSWTDPSNGCIWYYNLKGDATGNYWFFARPSSTYTVTASLSTAFGTATGPTYTVSTPSNPNTATQNVVINASDIYGRVTSASTGAAIGGATVAATLPAVPGDGCAVCATTDGNGNYLFWVATTGTYTVQSFASGYNVATAYPVVSAMGASYQQNFALTKSSGGGGGCVLAGTLIAVPNGQKRVEHLSEGDIILGYNVTTNAWVHETVTSDTSTSVSQVLSINSGQLVVTLTEQPLYVGNGTWTGWVHDPQNLTVGEQLYNPSTGSWVSITSLQVLQGTYTVYDLRVTSPNDFVANGVLALDKLP